jgi:serine/threonine protein kinase
MAPEMLKENTYDYKVDVWSCGVVLYEILHRGLPYKSDAYKNKHKVILKHLQNNKISYSKKLSNEVVDLLKKCLELDPKKRLSSAEILKHPWMNIESNSKRVATYKPKPTHTKHQWLPKTTEKGIECDAKASEPPQLESDVQIQIQDSQIQDSQIQIQDPQIQDLQIQDPQK